MRMNSLVWELLMVAWTVLLKVVRSRGLTAVGHGAKRCSTVRGGSCSSVHGIERRSLFVLVGWRGSLLRLPSPRTLHCAAVHI
jgi:hypothetical protein